MDNTVTLPSSLSLNNTLLDNDLLNQRVVSRISYNKYIGQLNINCVRNKFGSLIEIIKNFNIFLILESNPDASFPKNQFKINGYKCFRRDRSKDGGSLMFYFNKGILCTVLAK